MQSETDPRVILRMFWSKKIYFYQIPKKEMCTIALSKLAIKIKAFKQAFEVKPGGVAQSVGHLTCKSGVLGSIPGLATYFRFTFRFFKKGSCQLLAKVCARSTG